MGESKDKPNNSVAQTIESNATNACPLRLNLTTHILNLSNNETKKTGITKRPIWQSTRRAENTYEKNLCENSSRKRRNIIPGKIYKNSLNATLGSTRVNIKDE